MKQSARSLPFLLLLVLLAGCAKAEPQPVGDSARKFASIFALILLCLFMGCRQTTSGDETTPWSGKWILVEVADPDGVVFPLIGVFHYYQNGTFASQMTASMDRLNLTSDPSSCEEYQAVFDSYRAGFGTYTVNEEEGSLTYEYVSNMRPHRIAQPSKVNYEIEDDRLTLDYGEGGPVLTLRRE